MKFWFDTEFHEEPGRLELISIGIVSEDGREFYAENVEYDVTRASNWLWKNVIPHLTGSATTRKNIAERIDLFVGLHPEFWAYNAPYDWVLLCQLYGSLMNTPGSWSSYVNDVLWLRDQVDPRGKVQVPPPKTPHHALEDARWCRNLYNAYMAHMGVHL